MIFVNSILLFTIYCSLCLIGLLPDLAFCHPEKAALLEETSFETLLRDDKYQIGRVWFISNPTDGKCQFVPWKGIDVVFAYKNTARHTVILIESSAGGIICNIPHRMTGHPSLFKDSFLGENGILELAISEAERYLAMYNNNIYYKDGKPDNPVLPQCDQVLKEYAIQIWTSHVADSKIIRNGDWILIIQGNLKERFKFDPDIYTFAFTTPPVTAGITPKFTCAIWQSVLKIGDGSSIENVYTIARVYLGGTGKSQGAPGPARIGEVVEVFLSDWTQIGATKENGLEYPLSAFFKGYIVWKLKPWTQPPSEPLKIKPYKPPS